METSTKGKVNIKIGDDSCAYSIDDLTLLPYFQTYFSRRWTNEKNTTTNTSSDIVDICGNNTPNFSCRHLSILLDHAKNICVKDKDNDNNNDIDINYGFDLKNNVIIVE